MKRYNLDWKRDGEGWSAVDGRFTFSTWPFGGIHQASIEVSQKCGHPVQIGLECGKTRDEAMKRQVDWAEEYIKNGPSSVDKVFSDCFNNWPTLNRTRRDVINQLFCTLGGGYDWLDGVLICQGPDDHIRINQLDEKARNDPNSILNKSILMYEILIKESKSDEQKQDFQVILDLYLQEKNRIIGPFPEEPGPYLFYPVDEKYSNICRIPDNIRPDWLKLSYEAAILLRDSSDGKNNQNIGTKIVQELEKRFSNAFKSK